MTPSSSIFHTILVTIFMVSQYVTASSIITNDQRRRLQLSTQFKGQYGQTCAPPDSKFTCMTVNAGITDMGTGKVECGVAFGCCLCGTITCGTPETPCDGLIAGAAQSVYGVQSIVILGEEGGGGAVIDCGGTQSCAMTAFTGSWIDTIKCAGDASCVSAYFEVTNSNGIICGKNACQDATFRLSENRKGDIWCNSPASCGRADIEIGNIGEVKCNGDSSCIAATFTITDPREGFNLKCNGKGACAGLNITVIVPPPKYGYRCPVDVSYLAPLKFKGITCSAVDACKGMTFTVENNGCAPILLENLECEPDGSCSDLHLELDDTVSLQNCKCGASCAMASGIDLCFDNIRIVDCSEFRKCKDTQRTVSTPSNGFLVFCPSTESCFGMTLHIVVAGGSQNVVRTFRGFDCGGIDSCKGAEFNVVNAQNADLVIKEILCGAEGSCEDTTFVMGERVSLKEIKCIGERACNNCTVRMGGIANYGEEISCQELTNRGVSTEAPIVVTGAVTTRAVTTGAMTTGAVATGVVTTSAPSSVTTREPVLIAMSAPRVRRNTKSPKNSSFSKFSTEMWRFIQDVEDF